ncbi:hypothetical protein HN789_04115 [archaeon]|jgi:hypothetical protein|nr:hypothetical protein [archaeon]MBT4022491.1 hypothetical protein [archaeon]MBT4272330.1 hypothetical protein [archaeon]MBT4460439.1 hypothetical protein [archaeon]MBT4858458.1 hypothetical protein [archaeon]
MTGFADAQTWQRSPLDSIVLTPNFDRNFELNIPENLQRAGEYVLETPGRFIEETRHLIHSLDMIGAAFNNDVYQNPVNVLTKAWNAFSFTLGEIYQRTMSSSLTTKALWFLAGTTLLGLTGCGAEEPVTSIPEDHEYKPGDIIKTDASYAEFNPEMGHNEFVGGGLDEKSGTWRTIPSHETCEITRSVPSVGDYKWDVGAQDGKNIWYRVNCGVEDNTGKEVYGWIPKNSIYELEVDGNDILVIRPTPDMSWLPTATPVPTVTPIPTPSYITVEWPVPKGGNVSLMWTGGGVIDNYQCIPQAIEKAGFPSYAAFENTIFSASGLIDGNGHYDPAGLSIGQILKIPNIPTDQVFCFDLKPE